MGAVAVGATVYFGSEDSNRQMVEVAEAFAFAHELGMATILWCYMRNSRLHRKWRQSRIERRSSPGKPITWA